MNLPFGGFSRICTASEIVRAVVTNRGSIADGGYSTHVHAVRLHLCAAGRQR